MTQDLFWIKKRWRKKKQRNIEFISTINNFLPDNENNVDWVVYIQSDELECIRLKNIKKLSVRAWAVKMWISKSLFAKIYTDAIFKISDALVNWKEIRLK